MKNKLLLILWLAFCVSTSYAELKGDYDAPKLTGEFQKSAPLKDFIKQMSAKHKYKKSYLNGLFSQLKNRKNILKIINRPLKTIGTSKGSWDRYKKSYITNNMVNKGVDFWRKYNKTLQKVETTYKIPAEYVVAIIGMETRFGKIYGTIPVIDSLTTISFGNTRRSDYFKGELEEFLLMCQEESLDPRTIQGSYAGAMGYGQFMPSSFRKHTVDFNKDGKKDLWDMTDSIGSVANYFHKNGWQRKTAAIPAVNANNDYKKIKYGWRYPYTAKQLKSHGITPKKKIKITSKKLYFIRLTTYKDDELWIGGNNFYVITRYNNSDQYAMSVFLLAQKIRHKMHADL